MAREPGRWFLFTARDETGGDAAEQARAFGSGQLILDVVYDTYRHGIGPAMQRVLADHPDLQFYGWLADDTYPSTQDWDRELAIACDGFGLSYADDGGCVDANALRAGTDLSSGMCWSGDLVRATGWWAFPGLEAAWIDVIWTEIVAPLNLHRYRPDVLVEHRTWRNGSRHADDVDAWSARTIDRDAGVYATWRDCRDATLERVRRALKQHGYATHPAPLPLAP